VTRSHPVTDDTVSAEARLPEVLAAAVRESAERGYATVVVARADLEALLALVPAATSSPEPELDVERLAEAWANVMDGRRIGRGLDAARIGRDTTTPEDWWHIATEYARLAAGENARA
jgi:hypothetical protein